MQVSLLRFNEVNQLDKFILLSQYFRLNYTLVLTLVPGSV